jgi:hypothetical protein
MGTYQLFVLIKRERPMTFFRLVWPFIFVLLVGALAHATEIAGDWQAEDRAGKRLFYYFETDHTFFFEDETSWFQGTYSIEPDSVPGQLALYIQDGSHGEDAGKTVRYRYDIHDNLLTLTGMDQDETDRPTTLEVVDPAGSAVFIGINTGPSDKDDEDDEDDYNWNVYASCFIKGLAGIFSSP